MWSYVSGERAAFGETCVEVVLWRDGELGEGGVVAGSGWAVGVDVEMRSGERDITASTAKWSLSEQRSVGWRWVMLTCAEWTDQRGVGKSGG